MNDQELSLANEYFEESVAIARRLQGDRDHAKFDDSALTGKPSLNYASRMDGYASEAGNYRGYFVTATVKIGESTYEKVLNVCGPEQERTHDWRKI